MKVKVAVGGVNNAVMEKKKVLLFSNKLCQKNWLFATLFVSAQKKKKNIKNSSFILTDCCS